jgi:hypothetical protein
MEREREIGRKVAVEFLPKIVSPGRSAIDVTWCANESRV